MKQIVVLSGKGGTGKTTVAAALAHLASRRGPIVLADADVDASNLELLLAPQRIETHDFTGGQVAVVDLNTCTGCGLCQEVCRFEAISISPEGTNDGKPTIDPIACEGCASCFYRCPDKAIHMDEQIAGHWFRSDTRFGPLLHAQLFAAQENSGKLVTLVKQQARELGLAQGRDYLIIDGPPGIGCPVIAACSGADLALLVAEPTVAGVHDLERMLATTEHFGVPALVCINKHDINLARAAEIERYCASRGVEVVGRIPFDTVVTEAMVRGKTVTEYTHGAVSSGMRGIWDRIRGALAQEPSPGNENMVRSVS